MKTSYLIIVILALALVFTTYKLVAGSGKSEPTSGESDGISGATAKMATETAYKAIMTRTSVRSYSDKAVSDEAVDSLLRAAMAAPTAMNLRPWQFVVIRDRSILDSIASNCRNISMAKEAQLAIAVCGDLDIAAKDAGREYWIQDCSAATENLLVAANAMGLGAVWCGIYPMTDRVEFISNLLNLPSNYIPLNIIPIGYPSAATTPKDKYDANRIHTDRFQADNK